VPRLPTFYTPDLSFYEVLALAVNDFIEHGYDSAERLQMWQTRLKVAAQRSLISPQKLEQYLTDLYKAKFRGQVGKGALLKRHPGISKYTLENIAPKVHGELSRRIAASADLIKLNREKAVANTVQRLSGWATSIPAGGTEAQSARQQRSEIRKPLAQLPFEERRVIVDQGHKLVSNLSDIVATNGGAIAAKWNSHGVHDSSYDARPEHKARDGKVLLIRGSWALEKGFIKATNGFVDEIEKPGEFVYCRCWYTWYYNLRSLPAEMLTDDGREELKRVRALVR
jgi:hypothetical protein